MSAQNHISKLSFGTSGLMGAALTNKGRLELLETALDCGITHFDTAPLYGQGDAENVLGAFAKGRRDAITIATKFGLSPRYCGPVFSSVKPILRAINRYRLDVKNRLYRRQGAANGEMLRVPNFFESMNYEPEKIGPGPTLYESDLESQLTTSLRKLRSCYVDILFLHDVSLNQLTDEFVLALERVVERGLAKKIGLATTRPRVLAILDRYPNLNCVLQVPATPFHINTDNFVGLSETLICHSCLRSDPSWIYHRLTCSEIPNSRNVTDLILENSNSMNLTYQLMVKRSMQKNPAGSLLFSSSKKRNIATICQSAEISDEEMEILMSFLLQEQDDDR